MASHRCFDSPLSTRSLPRVAIPGLHRSRWPVLEGRCFRSGQDRTEGQGDNLTVCVESD